MMFFGRREAERALDSTFCLFPDFSILGFMLANADLRDFQAWRVRYSSALVELIKYRTVYMAALQPDPWTTDPRKTDPQQVIPIRYPKENRV